MDIGRLHLGKKNIAAEEARPEPEVQELPEAEEVSEELAVTEIGKKPKKKIKLNLPPLNRETIEKLVEKLKESREKKKKKRRVNISLRKAIEIVLILLVCFMMTSPLSYSVFSGKDYVSKAVAQEMSFADSGVSSDKAEGLRCDMIKLDDRVCYKVEFTSGINGYKYIVNADTGEIIAQAFYQLEKDKGD